MEKSKKKEEVLLIKEIIENKEKLLPKMNDLILNGSQKQWQIILDNHMRYSEVIEEYVSDMIDTKLKIDKCIVLLKKAIEKTNCKEENLYFLEITIKGNKIGIINDLIYDCIFDEKEKWYILKFSSKDIFERIKLIDDTKRCITLQMVYDGGITMNYNIKFDLDKINKNTNTIKGTYTATRL